MPVIIGFTILFAAVIYTIDERRKLDATNTKTDATIDSAFAELDTAQRRYSEDHRRDLVVLQAMDGNEANLHAILLRQQQIEALYAETT